MTRISSSSGRAAGSVCGGSDSRNTRLSPVSLQPVGDRTYGVRVENTTEGDTFQGGVVQVATASLGHNRVHVVHSAGEASTYRSEAVEQLVGATVAELEAL